MNVFLFGAGASHGIGDVIPEQPPLGDRLFDELARCFCRSWGSLPPDVRKLFSENFEKGMAELWSRFSPMVPELMQQMAIYFVQFRPRTPGETLYCRLVKLIESKRSREKVLLSTLNYECLLEHSLWQASIHVNYGEFPHADGITVWKLHGACNLLPRNIAATRGVSYTSGVSFETAIRPAKDLNEVLEFCLGNNALPPVMCLFMPKKPVQVSAGSISAIQAAWREKVMAADRVAVVGVFPNHQDTHIWDPLAETPAELLYIGGQQPFQEWAEDRRKGKTSRFLAERFDSAFDSLTSLMVT